MFHFDPNDFSSPRLYKIALIWRNKSKIRKTAQHITQTTFLYNAGQNYKKKKGKTSYILSIKKHYRICIYRPKRIILLIFI